MKTFTVISSNPNQKEGFVTKLSCETVKETVFGKKVCRETYYVSGSKQMPKDSKIDLDISEWRVAQYPFAAVNGDTGEVTNMELKWLHVKA